MKQVTIFKKDGATVGWGPHKYATQELVDAYVAQEVALNSWGLPERQIWEDESHDVADVIATESVEISPEHQEQVFEKDEGGALILDEQGNAIPVLDGEGNPTYETVAAVSKNMLTLKAEYVIETINLDDDYNYKLELCYNNRKIGYGSWQDQLDMQYHDKMNSTTTWEDHIAAVKLQYPLPVQE